MLVLSGFHFNGLASRGFPNRIPNLQRQEGNNMNEREIRLNGINEVLTQRNLKPLRKLGDNSKGEIETISILEVFDHSQRFFTDVKFAVKFPNGADGAFTVRFNANGAVSDGAVLVILINGKFAVLKQWRLPLGMWTYEMPRGFGDKLDQAKSNGELGSLKITDLPLGILNRELGDDLMANAQIVSVTHLGKIAENSGTSNIAPSHFLLQLKVDESKLNSKLKAGEEHLSIKLWDISKVRAELGQSLCDNHSITALALAFAHIESLPR